MKRKFKKFLYLVFSFLLIINFQNKSFTDEHLEKIKDSRYACNLFYQKVLESDDLRTKNFFAETSGYSFGFYPMYTYNDDKNKWELLTDGKSIKNQFNYDQDTAKLLKPNKKILKIEGIDAAEFYADWWKNISELETIELEIIDEKNEVKIIELKKKYFSYDKIFHYLMSIV